MTRLVLCLGLGCLCLAAGLTTAIVQSHNRGEGQRLNELREECMLIEATNGVRAEQLLELDHGPIAVERRRHTETLKRNGR